MATIQRLNTQFANLELGIEIRKHVGGLFYIVSLRDGKETILNSAMSLNWIIEWSGDIMRNFYRTFVRDGNAYYPKTGGDPVYHG